MARRERVSGRTKSGRVTFLAAKRAPEKVKINFGKQNKKEVEKARKKLSLDEFEEGTKKIACEAVHKIFELRRATKCKKN